MQEIQLNPKSIKVGVLFALLTLVILLLAYIVNSDLFRENLLKKELEDSSRLQAEWLMRNQTERGDFNYQIDTKTGKVTDGNKSVRQTLSLYSLSLYYKRTNDPKVKQALEKGIEFFKKDTLKKDMIVGEQLLSTEKIIYQNQDYNGATSFLLLAIIEYMESSDSNKVDYSPLALNLANHLLATQLPDGNFIYRSDPEVQDHYNTGEAFFALSKMAQFTNNNIYKKAAQKAGNYIISDYGGKDIELTIYGWAMQGFYYLYQIDPQEKYWNFMKQYTDKFLEKEGKYLEQFFFEDGAIAPSNGFTVLIEGLIHVAKLSQEKDIAYYQRLKKILTYSLKYSLSFQINGLNSKRISHIESLTGAMCNDYICKLARIDATGHNLSAATYYLSLINK